MRVKQTDVNHAHPDNNWSNETTMKKYIEMTVVPYINNKRKELNLSHDQPALLTFNNLHRPLL